MRPAIDLPELSALLTTADHVDVRSAEADVTLAEFVAGALGRPPGWRTRALFRARSMLARLLRLRHPDLPLTRALRPDQIPFAPGGKVGFFTVADAAEDSFILLEAADTHLTAHLAIVAEPATGGRKRFLVGTIVTYHNWTGPLYFAIIRPFHHVMIRAMVKAGVRCPCER